LTGYGIDDVQSVYNNMRNTLYYSYYFVSLLQIAKANIAGKPVVTATQMLESMINAPRPTRYNTTPVKSLLVDIAPRSLDSVH
jgi:Pyruvate kinase, barrel domain